jgi:hypothetical protein
VPKGSTVAGETKLKVPATEAGPPLRTDVESAWPKGMDEAFGHAVTVVAAWEMTSEFVAVPV